MFRLFRRFEPVTEISQERLRRGLRHMIHDGVCSQTMGVLTSGGFLVAFALLMGASNRAIGFIAAVGPLAQILQLPAAVIIGAVRRRKLPALCSSTIGRSAWFAIAVIPWLVPREYAVGALLLLLVVHFSMGAMTGCAWNSWVHDLVPAPIRGGYLGHRLAVATGIGAIVSLGAAAAIDYAGHAGVRPDLPYSMLFAAGGAIGLIGVYHLSRIPEPLMPPDPGEGVLKLLAEPLRDGNFRTLLVFLGVWTFAVNLAAPFYAVYMLKRLGLSLTAVIALTVLSQLVNALFYRIWGALADRFSNKSVLAVAGPQFILSILLWPFTTMPERYFLTIPLLIVIHLLAGISTAGVLLCTANIALKAAPAGRGVAYLATNSLVCGISATLAPILAGLAADRLAGREMALSVEWLTTGPEHREIFSVSAISLSGLDFIFLAAFGLGLIAIQLLALVREEGEVSEEVVAAELYARVRRALRGISSAGGLRQFSYFPYGLLGHERPPARLIVHADPERKPGSEASEGAG